MTRRPWKILKTSWEEHTTIFVFTEQNKATSCSMCVNGLEAEADMTVQSTKQRVASTKGRRYTGNKRSTDLICYPVVSKCLAKATERRKPSCSSLSSEGDAVHIANNQHGKYCNNISLNSL